MWFVVYPPSYEREIRARVEEFELATTQAGHGWTRLDVTRAFPEWMADHEYREGHFEDPDDVEWIMDDFERALAARIRHVLQDADDQTIVALTGIGTLFGLIYVSDVLEDVKRDIAGRLVVFFPGQRRRNTYRLLDARDGWDYLAVPITA
mgnify:CR=1 FL=1